MNIIIAGIGKVGATLVRQLSAEGHDLTLIDLDRSELEDTQHRHDLMTVEGNCASMQVLRSAGVESADLLIAVTDADEVNLLSCMTAHGLNPKIHTIARIRNPEYTQQIYRMRKVFNLSMAVNPERQAAVELERLLRLPGFLRRDSFAKGRAEIVELRLDRGSKLSGTSLMDLYRKIGTRVLVCTVLRAGQVIMPRGDFVLTEGDRIFVTAPTANLALLLKNLGVHTRRTKSVLIAGGGKVSFYLAQRLTKAGMDVKLIERDHDRCLELADLLPEATILEGDCADRADLEDMGLLQCDAFLSLTGVDEMNMITSLYALSRGVPQVITKLGRTGSTDLADAMNLGSVICPRELCGNEIVRYVRAMENQTGAAISVHAIADGQAEASEFIVEEQTPGIRTPLKDLQLRKGALIAIIAHNGRVEIPGGDSQMLPGDTVVVVTPANAAPQTLNEIFL